MNKNLCANYCEDVRACYEGDCDKSSQCYESIAEYLLSKTRDIKKIIKKIKEVM